MFNWVETGNNTFTLGYRAENTVTIAQEIAKKLVAKGWNLIAENIELATLGGSSATGIKQPYRGHILRKKSKFPNLKDWAGADDLYISVSFDVTSSRVIIESLATFEDSFGEVKLTNLSPSVSVGGLPLVRNDFEHRITTEKSDQIEAPEGAFVWAIATGSSGTVRLNIGETYIAYLSDKSGWVILSQLTRPNGSYNQVMTSQWHASGYDQQAGLVGWRNQWSELYYDAWNSHNTLRLPGYFTAPEEGNGYFKDYGGYERARFTLASPAFLPINKYLDYVSARAYGGAHINRSGYLKSTHPMPLSVVGFSMKSYQASASAFLDRVNDYMFQGPVAKVAGYDLGQLPEVMLISKALDAEFSIGGKSYISLNQAGSLVHAGISGQRTTTQMQDGLFAFAVPK